MSDFCDFIREGTGIVCTRCHESVRWSSPDLKRRCPAAGPAQPPMTPEQVASQARDAYREATRERWTEELHRSLDQVLGQIDRLAAAGLLPLCGCPDTLQALLTDLLTPGRWRAVWGDAPASPIS
jgi:hypothetical protein